MSDIEDRRKDMYRNLRIMVNSFRSAELGGQIDGFMVVVGRFLSDRHIMFMGGRRGGPGICREIIMAILAKEITELVKWGMDFDQAFDVLRGWALEGLSKDAKHQKCNSIDEYIDKLQNPGEHGSIDWERFWDYMGKAPESGDNTGNGREASDGP